MAPMEFSHLSSNWKKLQATLPKKEHKEETSLKRKRPDAATQKPAKKRSRLEKTNGVAHTSKSKASMSSSNGVKKLQHSRSAPALKTNTKKDSAHSDDDGDEETERPSSALAARDDLAESEAQVNEGVSQTAIAGKYIALDCEMVGYGPNPRDDSQLARVSLVNYHGQQIYDSLVLPLVTVTDYRTHITGITEATLRNGRPFKEVQRDVSTFLQGRVLVGHALKKDLDMLQVTHPRRDVRDTSRHATYRALSMGKTPALKMLCKEVLGLDIQTGHHSSVEDAKAAMLLYRKEKDVFEAEYAGKFGRRALMENAEGIVAGGAGGAKGKKKKKGKK